MTHYIPPFTRDNGRKQQALCAAYILPREHSPEPTCASCAEQLTSLDLRDADEAIGTEAPGAGVPYVDFDPITGDDLY